jgi:hypothetical protein
MRSQTLGRPLERLESPKTWKIPPARGPASHLAAMSGEICEGAESMMSPCTPCSTLDRDGWLARSAAVAVPTSFREAPAWGGCSAVAGDDAASRRSMVPKKRNPALLVPAVIPS